MIVIRILSKFKFFIFLLKLWWLPSADFQANLSWRYHQIVSVEDCAKLCFKNECTLKFIYVKIWFTSRVAWAGICLRVCIASSKEFCKDGSPEQAEFATWAFDALFPVRLFEFPASFLRSDFSMKLTDSF